MIRVSLTKTEFAVIEYVGKLRSQVTSALGKDMLQDTTVNGEQTSIDGVLSEYAVAKYLNLHLDLISHRGSSIDVKSTRTANGNLNAVGWSNSKTANIFILTEILASCVGIVGWIHRDSFLRKENLVTSTNRKPYYSVPRSKLALFYEQTDAKTL